MLRLSPCLQPLAGVIPGCRVQIGQGASPFGVAKLWRRVQGDDPSPVRAGAPGPARLPAEMSATATPPRVNLTVMSGEDLERHLTGLFGRRGYTVWPVPSRGEVGSALLICRGDQGVAVQVKRWNAPLGPEVVRAVLAALQHHSGTLARLGCSQMGGMVVGTAPFRDDARQLAAENGVLLWDREELEAQLAADLARPGGRA